MYCARPKAELKKDHKSGNIMQFNDVPGGFIEAVFPNGLRQRSQLILCKQSQIEPNQHCDTRKNRGTIDVQKKRDPGSVLLQNKILWFAVETCAAIYWKSACVASGAVLESTETRLKD
jgi:hypothetical protein